MSIKLIHIGMMKTAITYVQSLWLRDPQYAIACKGAIPVVQYIRQSTLDGTFNPKNPINIDIDRQPHSKQNIIVSQEGFSAAYLTDIDEKPFRQYIENASEMLGTLNKQTNSILICVRSPASWLRSMHSQFINEGQHGNGARFFELKEEFLRSCLDLEFIIRCYRKNFSNVVVLPFEYLTSDEEKFWGILKEKFSIPIPKVKGKPVNESVWGYRLPLMSRLNEISHQIRTSLSSSSIYRNKERDILVSNSENNDKWFNRRFCQYASDIEIERMCERLTVNEDLDKFRQIPITEDFVKAIEDKFIAPFERLAKDQELTERYRQELEDGLI